MNKVWYHLIEHIDMLCFYKPNRDKAILGQRKSYWKGTVVVTILIRNCLNKPLIE